MCAGWHEFSDIHPNAAHEGLARLQQRGWVDALITQNVDRLHSKGGASDVIELHGTTHRCAHSGAAVLCTCMCVCIYSRCAPLNAAEGLGATQGTDSRSHQAALRHVRMSIASMLCTYDNLCLSAAGTFAAC